MALFFLRHVKTVSNQLEVISGRMESRILSNQTLTIPENSPCFTKIFCSTSDRCKETLDLLPEQYINCRVVITDVLLERSLGVLEGIKREDAMKEHPEYFVDGRVSVSAAIESAESIQAVFRRVYDLTQVFLYDSLENNVLVCSHNQTLKIMYAILNDLEISDSYWKTTDFRNGEIVLIRK